MNYATINTLLEYIPDNEELVTSNFFEDAYGTDDMTNLENQILSNFKSFGSLVLDLTKRSKKRQTGSVSLGTN